MKALLQKTTLLLAIGIMLLPSLQAKDFEKRKKPNPYIKQADHQQNKFLSVNGAMGLWYHSNQPGMDPYQFPIDISVNYGNRNKPISYIGGFIFNTAFSQDIYVLKPRFLYLGIKYVPEINTPEWMEPYIAGGAAGWETILTDENYDGIINYQNKVERDRGIAGFARAGIDFKFNNFKIGPQFTYLLAQNGEYLAGAFEKRPINPGFMMLSLKIGYTFNLSGKSGMPCPSYY